MGFLLYNHWSGRVIFKLLLFICIFKGAFLDTIYEGQHFVEEGREFHIKCRTYRQTVLQWMKDGEKLLKSPDINMTAYPEENDEVNVIVIKAAKISDGGKYKCDHFDRNYHEIIVITGIGDEDGSLKVMEVDKPFFLQCNISATDNASLGVKWFKDGTELETDGHIIIHNSNNTLEILKPNDRDAGYYTCQGNYSDANTNFTFTVYSKPRIHPSFPQSVSHIQGDPFKQECTFYGFPLPEVEWRKDDVPINDSRIIITAINQNTSELRIDSLEESDRATYTCFVNNTVGSAESSILVRVKDKLAALWPFLGIVAEVGVLCTIIFIYEKRRAKQEFEESDTDQSPDTKNVADNKEKDVRQRK